jgi:GntR family transcriptional regulator/MocR family aminotransferase
MPDGEGVLASVGESSYTGPNVPGGRILRDIGDDLPGAVCECRDISSFIRISGSINDRPIAGAIPVQIRIPPGLYGRVFRRLERAARRLRRASPSRLAGGEVQGYGPLRAAIADYLGTSRGVDCTPDEVVILSGVQQGLDLLARFLVKRGDSVWIEDPAYPGAAAAFCNAGARLVPVPVYGDGFDPAKALRAWPQPRAVYVTPAH